MVKKTSLDRAIWGWVLSVVLAMAIVASTPMVLNATCNFGNCSYSALCPPEQTCVTQQTVGGVFDPECATSPEDEYPTCYTHQCEFGVYDWWNPELCLYPGMCGTDYLYTCEPW